MFRFALILSCLLVNFQIRATDGFQRSVVFKNYIADETPKIKAIPGMRQRNVGIGLTSAGLGLLGVGAILMATSNWQKIQTSAGTTYGTRDIRGALGMLLCVPGIGLTIPGGIIWGLGGKKIKKYRKGLLENREKIIPKQVAPDAIPIQERY
jgi:hypothetical protein